LKILYFTYGYTTHDYRFLSAIARSRHEILFLPLVDDGRAFEARPLPDGVTLVSWPGDRKGLDSPEALLRLAPEFQALLERVAPDLVHAGPVPSCGFLTALAGFHPFMLMSWGSDVLMDADKDPLSNWVARYALRQADCFVCDCDAVRLKVAQWRAFAPGAVVQFPWGVDLAEFRPGEDTTGLRRTLGWQEAIVVVSCRAWAPGYGIEVALEAFLRAYRQNPKLRLLLLGHGPLAEVVTRFIQESGLTGCVHAPGLIPEARLGEYFHAADFYLSATPSDGSSISLLQALACALPAIVADAPGNREWVREGENGYLAASLDPDAFASALLGAASLPHTERLKLGQVARHTAERGADWQRNLNQLLDTYDRLEASHGR
jgi:glycosyltransferase involved in cell wall biosynthesis